MKRKKNVFEKENEKKKHLTFLYHFINPLFWFMLDTENQVFRWLVKSSGHTNKWSEFKINSGILSAVFFYLIIIFFIRCKSCLFDHCSCLWVIFCSTLLTVLKTKSIHSIDYTLHPLLGVRMFTTVCCRYVQSVLLK